MGLVHITSNASGVIRNERMEDRDYVVVPMIMMVEGVLNGSGGPLLYPAEELSKVPQVWNQKPVVVYHPQMNGKALSACDQEVINTHKIGVIMNTTFDGKRLRAEAWLEPSRIAKVDNRIQEALDNDKMMELSTGLFTENDPTPGEFNGKPYDAIARNYRPDHLAILPDQIGACSIADGAGFLRTNAKNKREMEKVLNFLGVENELAHSDIRDQLRAEVQKGKPEGMDVWIEDVFDTYFVYEEGGTLYQQDYSIKNDMVSISGMRTEVVRKTVYEDAIVGNALRKGESDMGKKEKVEAIIANTEWEEDDRDFLMKMDEKKLDRLLPKTNEAGSETPPENPEENNPVADDKGTKTEETAAAPATNAAPTVEQFIANAPAEIREVLQDSLQTHAQRKASLIAEITANKKNIFTKEQLASMNANELTAIAALAKVEEKAPAAKPNFYGMAPVVDNAGAEAEEALVAPVMNFGKED